MKATNQTNNISDYVDTLVDELLSPIFQVSDNLRKQLHENAMSLFLQKDELLLRQGETCEYVYFIVSGALMGYTDIKRKRIVTYISVENEFVSSLSGWFGSAPSREAVVSLEDTLLLGIRTEVLYKLFQTQLDLNYIFRTVIEKYYLDAQERSFLVRIGSVKERYQYYKQTNPDYMERFPIDAIASLLDMQASTLLRLQRQDEEEQKKSDQTRRLRARLETLLSQEQLFKDKNLSLQQLAIRMDITTHKLSWLLNSGYGVNFKNFINGYRIDYIADLLRSNEYHKNYTIEALAEEGGFSSRSTFYNSFKKRMGKNPIAYAQAYVADSAVVC